MNKRRLAFSLFAVLLCAALLLYFHTQDKPPAAEPLDGQLRVAFFDVGQADCILVSAGENHMLIDAGDIGSDSLILGYLAEYGVTQLDYIAATHPHADHIGSMAGVLRGMERTGEILMPDITATTKTFERLLDAIEETNTPVTVPQPGGTFALGGAEIEVLAPMAKPYKNLNNHSIVLRVTYGGVSFLFTGDAEDISEEEQLASNRTLQADVLKVGHHGSSSSTTEAYLKAVNPQYAVISCGKGNSYNHPHRETLEKLANIKTYRTDLDGTVVFITDGAEITVSTGGLQ